MTWIIFALLVAIFYAAKSAASKRSLRQLDVLVVSWFIHALPALLILTYIFIPVPVLKPEFYPVLLLDCVLSVLATVLNVKAFHKSDLSVTTPMAAFTPMFMLVTSFFMLGEFPDWGGVVGVMLIVAGAYSLNIKEKKNGWKMPFKALLREDGPKLMLGAAFLWSITGNLDKIAVQNSSPVFFAFAENVVVASILLPFAWKRLCEQKREIKKDSLPLLAVGAFSALMLIFQMIALTQTLAVYVIAIKRLGILLSIILGGVIFKEKEMKTRLLGGAIMVLGVLFISLL
jgi:drug/metabolite transporter (DMT)-like permease